MHRRSFLAASAGIAVSQRAQVVTAANPTEREVDFRGKTRADLPTPALLVDLTALEANLSTMAEHCKKAGCGIRPHAKTHKCPEIAKLQVKSGALGVCVATVPEAEVMTDAGIRGVLLTSPIMEPTKIARMVALAQKAEVMLALGHARQAEMLSEAAQKAAVTIDVLIDVDVGDRRTGALPDEPAVELARLVTRNKHLRLRGIQAYAGLASHVVGFTQRERVSREAMGKALSTRDLFTKAGLNVAVLSGGSTGTYNIDSALRGVTELQAGSYVFMDVDYRRIGGRNEQAIYSDFRPSLTVLTTVVSATHADRVTVDAGTKALDTTVSWRPQAKDGPGLAYRPGGDEFGILTAEKDAKLPRLGDRLEFIVPHCDPTTNLHDRIYAMRGERVEAVWPLLARRESRER
jgi:D-serine deaminase-like pyridoxal phosphate-dependent protein